MISFLLAWVLTAPTGSLMLVPQAAQNALIIEDPTALSLGLSSFAAQGSQRTLMTLVARMRQRASREFGVDMMDAAARTQAGLKADAPFAVVSLTADGPPVLVLPAVSEDALAGGLKKTLGSAYVTTTDAAARIGAATLHTLTVGDVVTPRLLWATVGPRTFITGPRGKTAIEQLVRAAAGPWLADHAQAVRDKQSMGANQLYWARHSASADAWQMAGMAIAGSTFSGQAPLPQNTVFKNACTKAAHQSAQAGQSLADALQPEALAHGFGASTQIGVAAAHERLDPQQLSAALGPAAADRLARLLGSAPQVREALGDLDAPFAWALYPRGNSSGAKPKGLLDTVQGVLVVQALSAQDKARLKSMAKRLNAEPPTKPPLRKVRLRGHWGPSVHRPSPLHGWDMAVVDDTLLVTFGAGAQDRTLPRLEPWRTPQGQNPKLPPALLRVTAHLDDMAQSVQAAILSGAQGPLAGTPLETVPQLLLFGPTGDLIREVGALGRAQADVVCQQQAPVVTWTITQVTP